MKAEVNLPSRKWAIMSGVNELKLCKMADRTQHGDVAIIITLVVKDDLSWTLHVHDRCIQPLQCTVLKHFPTIATPSKLNEMLQHIDRLSVCPGHPDEHFIQMAKQKKSVKDGQTLVRVDDFGDVSLNGQLYSATLRTSTCEMLVACGKCPRCVSYRPSLRKMYNRWWKSTAASPTVHTRSDSHTNFRYLTTPQKKRRMESLRARVSSAELKVARLLKKIKASIGTKGVEVDRDLHEDLSKIMEDNTQAIHEQFPEGSFKRLFWEQQRDALNSSPRQMRWHPTMIKIGALILNCILQLLMSQCVSLDFFLYHVPVL